MIGSYSEPARHRHDIATRHSRIIVLWDGMHIQYGRWRQRV
jgi:hypothetical protein